MTDHFYNLLIQAMTVGVLVLICYVLCSQPKE